MSALSGFRCSAARHERVRCRGSDVRCRDMRGALRYSNFEDLPVWKAAIEFALKLFEFTCKADFRGFGDTKNQLERAGVSISNNIAEGFERGSNVELIQFLYISKGSAGECRSMLRLCEATHRFSNFKSEISNLIECATGISKQLNGWTESLKNSKIKGNKFLTQRIARRSLTKSSSKNSMHTWKTSDASMKKCSGVERRKAATSPSPDEGSDTGERLGSSNDGERSGLAMRASDEGKR